MTQEEKDLLLKDLCARLPYGIVGLYTWKCKKSHNRELTGNLYDELQLSWSYTEYSDSQFLPYLRSMLSMTGEEENEYNELMLNTKVSNIYFPSYEDIADVVDWLNEHHFDYRGLIPKGLAIEVTKENNPYN